VKRRGGQPESFLEKKKSANLEKKTSKYYRRVFFFEGGELSARRGSKHLGKSV